MIVHEFGLTTNNFRRLYSIGKGNKKQKIHGLFVQKYVTLSGSIPNAATKP
jgi:hypothetical protein